MVLERVNEQYLCKTYQLTEWSDATDFLEKLAMRTGKLLKVSCVVHVPSISDLLLQGGEADVNTVARMVLNDFQRGKLPYFVKPPAATASTHNVCDVLAAFIISNLVAGRRIRYKHCCSY